ncbi:MAG: proton-conducting transporter membrane subunit [Candidatus Caldarchaeum sp.]
MSLLAALPVVVPFLTGVLMLVLYRRPVVQKSIALGGKALTLALSSALLYLVWVQGIQVHTVSGWPPPAGIILVADLLSSVFVVMTVGIFLASLVYGLAYIDEESRRISYLPLVFFLLAGINGAYLTGDIFNLFVFIEITLLATYGLVLIRDPDGIVSRREKMEAVFKFLVLNLLGAFLMLVAVAVIYSGTGTLNMAELSQRLTALRSNGVTYLEAAAFMLLTTFGLKAALFPFHFWLPDLHPSAPIPIHAILSGVVIKVGAYAIIRLTTLFFPGFELLNNLLVVLSLATILMGGFMALGQLDIKRLLAYSSVSQMGFILLGLGLGGGKAVSAAVLFAINHAIIKTMLFLTAGTVIHITRTAYLPKLGGLSNNSTFLTAAFFIGAMSITGVPPMNGFVSKFLIFQLLLEKGQLLYFLTAFAGALMTLFYSFRPFIKIFWGEVVSPPTKPVTASYVLPIASLAFFCIFFGVFAEPLLSFVNAVGEQVSNPSVYYEAVERLKTA